MTVNLKLPPSARICAALGREPGDDEAKIRIDMPLPMPRWVMSSPSHMTMAVPAVSVDAR